MRVLRRDGVRESDGGVGIDHGVECDAEVCGIGVATPDELTAQSHHCLKFLKFCF